MTKKAYKTRIKLSKEHLDIEVRNVVRKVAHRPAEDVAQIIKERTSSVINPDYLESLLKEYRK